MATNRPESKTLQDVRRWRKDAYEARQRMSPEEVARHDRGLAAKLGLRVVSPEDLARSRRTGTRGNAA